MKEAALALDDDRVVMLVGQDEFFGRAREEIADDAVDRAAIAGDKDARLARGHKRGVHAGAVQSGGDLDCRDHLAATAIVADGMNAEAVGANPLAVGHVPLVVAAEVDQFPPVPPGNLGQFAIVGQELVHPGDDRHAAGGSFQEDRSPPGRKPAAGRSDADHQGVGLGGVAQAGDHGDVAAHAQPACRRLARPLPVQDRRNLLRPIANDANGRLGRVRIAMAVGQEDHSARGGRGHVSVRLPPGEG